MKLYDADYAPSPRRVRMFMAEKGLNDVERIKLDLPKGDNLSEEFAVKNPLKKVPVLELDDGSCISEAAAIYRYLEETCDGQPLLGETAVEKAVFRHAAAVSRALRGHRGSHPRPSAPRRNRPLQPGRVR